MPMCLIVGCSRKTGRGKRVRLYRVPAIITNQGPEVEELSIERRRLWISAISRADLTDKILNSDKVCDRHFHSGTAAPSWDRYNIDWVPTLNLGHDKTVTQSEQHQAQSREARAERSKERRKRQAEQQEQERLLKQQKLNEPGVPLADFAAEMESASTSSEQGQVENLDLQTYRPARIRSQRASNMQHMLYSNRSFRLFISLRGISFHQGLSTK